MTVKRHSHFSYFFWTLIAVSSGVIAVSLAINGVRASIVALKSATEPIIYEARAEENQQTEQVKQEISRRPFYKTNKSTKPPVISASSYLIVDMETKDVILEKTSDAVMPIASLTKLMTAVVYMESDQPNQTTIIPSLASSLPEANSGNLREGQIIPSNELIYPLLLESSNISAETIAENIDRKKFIKKMNDRALSIGMKNTFFEDPSGISPNNTSTASNLFKLLYYINNDKKNILDITTRKEQKASDRVWVNNDKFAGAENFLGGKTGFTQAAQKTFAGIFSLPLSKNGDRKIAVIMLKSKDREDDVLKMLYYLKNNVSYEENL